MRRNHFKCKICYRPCSTHHYGVFACEACKQFFRRIVTRCEMPICEKDGNCYIKQGEICRGCRLKKCLLMGMNSSMVQLDGVVNGKNVDEMRRYHEEINAKQRELQRQYGIRNVQQININSALGNANALCHVQRLINFLDPLETVYTRVWASTQPLPVAYKNRHQNIVELLNDNTNSLLQLGNEHFKEPGWNKAHLIEEIENRGLFGSSYIELIVKDWFLAADGAKAMPFFKQLDMHDQIALMQRIALPVDFFCGSYFSLCKGSQTRCRANGLTSFAILEAKQYRNDLRLHSLYKRINNQIVEQMAQIGIDRDEYLLLFSLLFTNADSWELAVSGHGRNLLYAKSVEYTRKLHELLQSKYGIFAGAQRLAVLMNLLGMVNRVPYFLYEAMFRIGFFYEQKRAFSYILNQTLVDLLGDLRS